MHFNEALAYLNSLLSEVPTSDAYAAALKMLLSKRETFRYQSRKMYIICKGDPSTYTIVNKGTKKEQLFGHAMVFSMDAGRKKDAPILLSFVLKRDNEFRFLTLTDCVKTNALILALEPDVKFASSPKSSVSLVLTTLGQDLDLRKFPFLCHVSEFKNPLIATMTEVPEAAAAAAASSTTTKYTSPFHVMCELYKQYTKEYKYCKWLATNEIPRAEMGKPTEVLLYNYKITKRSQNQEEINERIEIYKKCNDIYLASREEKIPPEETSVAELSITSEQQSMSEDVSSNEEESYAPPPLALDIAVTPLVQSAVKPPENFLPPALLEVQPYDDVPEYMCDEQQQQEEVKDAPLSPVAHEPKVVPEDTPSPPVDEPPFVYIPKDMLEAVDQLKKDQETFKKVCYFKRKLEYTPADMFHYCCEGTTSEVEKLIREVACDNKSIECHSWCSHRKRHLDVGAALEIAKDKKTPVEQTRKKLLKMCADFLQ
jgi:hypothetical protein